MTRPGSLSGEEARSRLYEAMMSDAPLVDRFERALDVGVEYFGVDHGYIAEIDTETGKWETVASTDPPDGRIPVGLDMDLSKTYCRRTIRSENPVAFADVLDHGLAEDPAYQTTELRCYHGAPVHVDDEPYGTVCFSDSDPRAEPFSDAEKSFTHLLGRMVGQEIEQDRYERDLDERREVYRAVIDASFDLVFRVDTAGRFSYLSDPVEDLLGYDPNRLLDEPFTTVLSGDETVELAWELFERVTSGETVEEEYLPLESAAGDRLYVDIRATPVYRSDVSPDERTPDDIVEVQGMAREATERYRRDRLIGVLNRVLRHNVRTDMNAVGGYADLLVDELTGEQATFATRIRDTAERLSALAETARDLERNLKSSTGPEPVDVVSLVTRIAERVDGEFPDASVTVETPDSAVALVTPSLETALWELVENAARHAGDAPSIDIGVRTTDDDVVVRVVDDGPGLPEVERSVFVTGEETPLDHGQGLGLWLVHWIVTGMGGETVVRDDVDGACVEVRLDRAVDAAGAT